MSHKLLVADDSQTIQKVIKITLANEPFELIECCEEESLEEKVKTEKPHAVLLDFNLSESKTGYELCEQITKLSPETKILMLYGTFDTVEDDKLKEVGCDFHIIKPFDGSKFIKLCHALADGNPEEEPAMIEEDGELPDPIEAKEESDDAGSVGAEDEEWVVNQPDVETEEPKVITEAAPVNSLQSEISDWGMEVPSVIGQESSDLSLPPIIETDQALPSDDDLDFPDPIEPHASSSELTPLEDLNTNEGFMDPMLSLESNPEELNKHVEDLSAKISDEVDSSDLWSVDDESISSNVEPVAAPISTNNSIRIDEDTFQRLKRDILFELEERIAKKVADVAQSEIQKFCEKHVDRVSWEVIPDLAENIIKKEIEQISKSLQN